MPKLGVNEAVEMFLVNVSNYLKPSTVDLYRRYAAEFAKAHNGLKLAEITPAAVTSWARTFHRQQAVRRLTAWATREAKILSVDPLDNMRKIRQGHRRRVLSAAERVTLRRASCRAFRDFLLALEETGARPQEIRSAKWENVRGHGGRPATRKDLSAGEAFFFFPTGKATDRRRDATAPRIIPVSIRLGRLLLRLLRRKELPPGRFIFGDTRNMPWSTNAVRCQMRRLRRRCQLDEDENGERVVCYSQRHTFATDAVAAGVKDFTLAELLGHASPTTTRRYVHLSPRDVCAAARSVAASRRQ